MNVSQYYAWLTRFQEVAHGLAHDAGRRTLTVHRRLRGDDGTVSGDVLHALVLDALTATASDPPTRDIEVLDAGCGLGGTILYLHERLGGRYTGLTLSPDQCRRATLAAAARGRAADCRFVVRDYDADLTDLVPDGVDVVLAIESLAHAPDPAATLARLAGRLRDGGRLLIVDDVPRDGLPGDDPDFAAFRAGWLAPAIASERVLAAALDAAGLAVWHEVDLTPRLPSRRPGRLAALVWLHSLAAWPARFTPARVLSGALGGGLRLERLYRRELVRYRLLVAGRGAAQRPTAAGSLVATAGRDRSRKRSSPET